MAFRTGRILPRTQSGRAFTDPNYQIAIALVCAGAATFVIHWHEGVWNALKNSLLVDGIILGALLALIF